jgi:hypothetical protein
MFLDTSEDNTSRIPDGLFLTRWQSLSDSDNSNDGVDKDPEIRDNNLEKIVLEKNECGSMQPSRHSLSKQLKFALSLSLSYTHTYSLTHKFTRYPVFSPAHPFQHHILFLLVCAVLCPLALATP